MYQQMNRRSESEPERQTLRGRIRETTVQAILAAAEEVFADDGFHAARMGAIAAKAGVSVGTLYNHFEDREALLGGLLAAHRGELLERIDRAIEEAATRPLRERLRGIVGAFLGHCEQHRKFVNIALQREMGRFQQTLPAGVGQEDRHDAGDPRARRRRDEARREGTRAAPGDGGARGGVLHRHDAGADHPRRSCSGKGQGMAAELDGLLDMFFDGAGVGARRGAA